MGKGLSEVLRSRVIAAVEGGVSRRAAAARFGVSASSAIRWVREWRQTGRKAPRQQGGDRLSHRIEAHADLLLAEIASAPDRTLEELRALLLCERMAHPVRKRFLLGDLNSLRQRMRPVGGALAKMEIRASRAS